MWTGYSLLPLRCLHIPILLSMERENTVVLTEEKDVLVEDKTSRT